MKASRVFLVGFMGAGKSAVGRALAALADIGFADTDCLVEKAVGMPIAEIFQHAGEGAFREAEWSALKGLDASVAAIVATGGGLFLGVENRRLVRRLTGGFVSWASVNDYNGTTS